MKRVSKYLPKVLNKYYVTKNGNVYSKQYNVDKYIKALKLRKKGLSYKGIGESIDKPMTTTYRMITDDIKPLYKKLKGKIDKDGYIEYILYTKDGGKKYLRGHRIVGYCYLNLTDDYIINHKNGIKNDNRVVNLEVVTNRENIIHSINVLGKDYTSNLPDNSIPVKVVDLKNKETNKFDSAAECCEFYNDFCYHYILRKEKGEPFEYHDNYLITIG